MKSVILYTISILVVISPLLTDVAGLDNRHMMSKNGIGLKGKSSKGKSSKGKSAERAVTMWWVMFNKPSACSGGPGDGIRCAISDVMGSASAGTNDPNISIFHASGGVSNHMGHLRLTGALYRTQCNLDLVSDSNDHYVWGGPPPLYLNQGFAYGYCPATGEDTEVHVVFRDHGEPMEGTDLLWQITRFTDPACTQSGGNNTCVDVGVTAFVPFSQDGFVTKEVGGFPVFPEGCAINGQCTAMQEAVQLSLGMGNEITLIRTGDALQVVAKIHLPMV